LSPLALTSRVPAAEPLLVMEVVVEVEMNLTALTL
jgi:hypothetical protein